MNAPAQSSATLIAAYLDAVIRKDSSAVDQYFDPDVEYMVNGAPFRDPSGTLPPISNDCHTALPWLGIYQGREALKGFLAHMHRNLEVTAFGPREVIAEGNKASAFGWFRLHALSTDRTVDIAYAIRVELRNGLIIRYHFIENTFDVAGAFRTGGAWAIETDGAARSIPAATAKEGQHGE
jgi:ketosteroid isomerase-like protein